MKRKFKVGDRVKCVRATDGKTKTVGKYGVVKTVGYYIGVEFDEDIDGHDCSGTCKKFHGWGCLPDTLELVTKETIVIYRKGDEVIALDKGSGKTGVAKCGSKDTFDFATGAKIAFERLLGDPKPAKPEKTPLNVKIVFTKGDRTFKTGHIYEVKDGNLNIDGFLCPSGECENFTKFYSIEELEDYFKPYCERKLHKTGWNNKHLKFAVLEED